MRKAAWIVVVSVQTLLIVGLVVWVIRLQGGQVAQLPVEKAPAASSAAIRWELRSQHLLYGLPQPVDDRHEFVPPGSSRKVAGISVLIREGFAVGHCDSLKIPLWVSAHWTRESWQRAKSENLKEERKFKADPELPEYARGQSGYGEFARKFDRGHLAPHQMNIAWGADSADAGCLMSNVVPEDQHLNRGLWLALEEKHVDVVSQGPIREIWVVCGPVLENAQPVSTLGNGVGVPGSFFKIISWIDQKKGFQARAFLFPQEASGGRLESYMVSVDEIEKRTGLDFFPELDPATQQRSESGKAASLWDPQ